MAEKQKMYFTEDEWQTWEELKISQAEDGFSLIAEFLDEAEPEKALRQAERAFDMLHLEENEEGIRAMERYCNGQGFDFEMKETEK